MSLLNRRDAVRELLRERGELIVVAGLGAPAYDLASCGNQPLDFPLWGAMGGAAMVGLGLALAQPQHRVLVLTGDGEMLTVLRHDLHTCEDIVFAVVKIAPEELPRVLPPRDGPYVTQRLRAALLGAERSLEG